MAKLTYTQQLQHPNWQRRRLEILKRDEFMCQWCYDSESTLHVHHKHYTKGKMAWEYADHELVTLCASCHEGIDVQDAAEKQIMAKLPIDGPFNVGEALALIAGWAEYGVGDMSEFEELSPFNFVLGQIIAHISDGLNYSLDDATSLLRGLSSVDKQGFAEAMELLCKSLKRFEPRNG